MTRTTHEVKQTLHEAALAHAKQAMRELDEDMEVQGSYDDFDLSPDEDRRAALMVHVAVLSQIASQHPVYVTDYTAAGDGQDPRPKVPEHAANFINRAVRAATQTALALGAPHQEVADEATKAQYYLLGTVDALDD